MATTTLLLAPGQPWSRPVPDFGFSLRCVRGRAWITVEGRPDDVLLAAGQSLDGEGRGLVVVDALEPAELAWAETVVPAPAAWLGRSRRTSVILALLALYLIWGSTYFALAVGVRHVPPFMFASARFAIAGVMLAAIALVRGERWPGPREALRGAIVGALLFVAGNGGVTFAEREVSSGLTAVAVASMPIWVAVFAALSGERPSRREAIGLVLGLAGVVALHAGQDFGGSRTSAMVLLMSPIGWAIGSLLSRRWALGGGAAGLATEMLPAALVLALLGAITGERVPAVIPGVVIGAMAYLVIAGSLIGVSAYAFLLRATRPAVATSYAYVNPIVAVLLGMMVGGESIGGSALVAGALILAGVALATWRR